MSAVPAVNNSPTLLRLGYAVGTGDEVTIPLHHLVVCGLTQMSGKTTTLEALAWRAAEYGAVLAFSTKPHEDQFDGAGTVAPFFRERCDWEYVQDLLEASLQERLKFERSWIIQACKGARSLSEVQANVRAALAKARGISHSVYTNLDAYFDKVLPEIRRIKFAPKLALEAGAVGVMRIESMRTEVQSLVIRSVISEVWAHHRNTIVILPEAWKFLPQARGNPVKRGAERLVREGAVSGNFLWIDSQDITGVDKQILKSMEVWLLGRQREHNEIRRMLAQIPSAAKPKPEAIARLPLGQFIACFGDRVVQVYVQPDWMPDQQARDIALGKMGVHQALAYWHRHRPERPKPKSLEEDMSRIAELEEALESLKKENENLRAQVAAANDAPGKDVAPIRAHDHERRRPSAGRSELDGASVSPLAGDVDAIVAEVLRRVRSDPQALSVIVCDPQIRIHHQPVELRIDGDSLRGRLARLIQEGWFDEARNGNAAFNELKRRGARIAKPNVYRELDKLSEWGFVTREPAGYQAVASAKRRVAVS